ncbi:DUF1989 domain-containing protein [soil metagenome]
MSVQSGPLAGRMTRRAAQVRAGKAEVFELKTDQFLQISDMIGKQVAIMTAFNTEDHSEFLSTAHTRAINHSLLLLKDHGIYSNKRNKMMTVIDDTVGRHDILFPLDDSRAYHDDYGVEDHRNSLDALADALKSHDIEREQIPIDVVNWFMHVALKPRGELEVREPLSERNSNVILKAHMPLLVAIIPSPNDQSPMNAFKPTDILIRIYM